MNEPTEHIRSNCMTRLQQFLPPERVAHSVNVARAAEELARRFCPELAEKAWLAGLLHDNAKSMDDAEVLRRARELGLRISAGEATRPALLHGKVGAALLAERFGVQDVEIGRAVADHVTGHREMGQLSLVLFVADQIAADREFSGVEELRRVAEEDLRRAAALVSRLKLMYILSRSNPIITETVEVYNELQPYLRVAHE